MQFGDIGSLLFVAAAVFGVVGVTFLGDSRSKNAVFSMRNASRKRNF